MVTSSTLRFVFTSLTTVVITLSLSAAALARPAVLTSTDSSSRINVRSQPSTSSSSPHYGFAGDRVETIRETTGSDGYTWYYVRFNNSGAVGWIRGDFVRIVGGGNPNPPTRWSKTYYCGAYTITLRDLGGENYSYSSRSRFGNINLRNGSRSNIGRAWQYAFYNSDTMYEITDAWATGSNPGNATLRVTEYNRTILRERCSK